MSQKAKCGKISAVKDGWVICPVCGRGKLIPVEPESVIRNVSFKCKRCGCISKVHIEAQEPASHETSA